MVLIGMNRQSGNVTYSRYLYHRNTRAASHVATHELFYALVGHLGERRGFVITASGVRVNKESERRMSSEGRYCFCEPFLIGVSMSSVFVD